MRILRSLFVLLVVLLLGAGVVYYLAGRASGPELSVQHPPVIGQAARLEVTARAPAGRLDALDIHLEQNGRTIPVFSLDAASGADVTREGADGLRVARTIGKKAQPDLLPGKATLVVAATRPVLRGLRHVSSRLTRELELRFDPPQIGVVSTKHYVNQGGSEVVVYRVDPENVESGVRVGELTYPGFAGSGAGLGADPRLKVAFFALRYDQSPDTPMELYAKDAAGNEASAPFDHQVFPKKFRTSRIAVDDRFLGRVVPAILRGSPQLGANPGDLLPSFLKINGDLRRINAEAIAALARQTAPAILWHGAFQPLGGSQVEAAFADFRTYLYQGKEVDHQVHLGFDLAKTANARVIAANDGRVLHAADLGIYGNCIILDHGMGVQSLYAHLSSFQVKQGQEVHKGQTLGLTGQTGLAGGDHLHFSMLVNGQFVNATEWWDAHWIQDRVMRKLTEAGAVVAP